MTHAAADPIAWVGKSGTGGHGGGSGAAKEEYLTVLADGRQPPSPRLPLCWRPPLPGPLLPLPSTPPTLERACLVVVRLYGVRGTPVWWWWWYACMGYVVDLGLWPCGRRESSYGPMATVVVSQRTPR